MKDSNSFKRIFIYISNALIDAFFPRKCLLCNSFFKLEISDETLGDGTPYSLIVSDDCDAGRFGNALAPYICVDCLDDFRPIESPKCSKCDLMFESREGDDHVCGRCLKTSWNFRTARSFGAYETVLRKAIHHYKYKDKIQLARPFGQLLFYTFTHNWAQDDIDLIIPLPLHGKRMRKRGFNQSYLPLKKWPGLAALVDFKLSAEQIDRSILFRTRSTKPQMGLDRKQRKANIKNAFKVKNISKIKGKRILLVDDVFTTGSTADECARILIRNGALHVDVLTLGRTMFS